MTDKELDALIAQKVMGWKLTATAHSANLWVDQDNQLTGWCDGDYPNYLCWATRVWRPSTDWGAAGVVLEKLRQMRFIIRLGIINGQFGWPWSGWRLTIWKNVYRDSGLIVEDCRKTPYDFYKELSFEAEGDTGPLAICHTALKVFTEEKS